MLLYFSVTIIITALASSQFSNMMIITLSPFTATIECTVICVATTNARQKIFPSLQYTPLLPCQRYSKLKFQHYSTTGRSCQTAGLYPQGNIHYNVQCNKNHGILLDVWMLLLFSPIFLSDNFISSLLCSIFCSKFIYIASYLTVISYTKGVYRGGFWGFRKPLLTAKHF